MLRSSVKQRIYDQYPAALLQGALLEDLANLEFAGDGGRLEWGRGRESGSHERLCILSHKSSASLGPQEGAGGGQAAHTLHKARSQQEVVEEPGGGWGQGSGQQQQPGFVNYAAAHSKEDYQLLLEKELARQNSYRQYSSLSQHPPTAIPKHQLHFSASQPCIWTREDGREQQEKRLQAEDGAAGSKGKANSRDRAPGAHGNYGHLLSSAREAEV